MINIKSLRPNFLSYSGTLNEPYINELKMKKATIGDRFVFELIDIFEKDGLITYKFDLVKL